MPSSGTAVHRRARLHRRSRRVDAYRYTLGTMPPSVGLVPQNKSGDQGLERKGECLLSLEVCNLTKDN
jgi:hypothetical protein